MQWYKADLHIHTVLSPCGGLDMSPVNIIKQAIIKKLDIIAITDHNSTKHCRLAQEIGERNGITVLAGAEINTKEEIHCLAFFEDLVKAEKFQEYLDENLNVIENNPKLFGQQLVVDEEENILEEENRLLVASLKTGIDEISEYVSSLGGLCVPAHINRMHSGIYNQIGFLPPGARFDALEVLLSHDFRTFLEQHPETGRYTQIANSDAHNLGRIGAVSTSYFLEKPEFSEVCLALANREGRKVSSL